VHQSEDLRQIAIAAVARLQPCRPEALVSQLRQAGASEARANRMILELIRDGNVKRTAFGELVLPGHRGSDSGFGYPIVVKLLGSLLLLAILVFMAWVFYNLITGARRWTAEQHASGASSPNAEHRRIERVGGTSRARHSGSWRIIHCRMPVSARAA
jgi:hypothetical protein